MFRRMSVPFCRKIRLSCVEHRRAVELGALTLRWDDVDLAERSLRLVSASTRRNKSGKTRVISMTTTLHETLQGHAARFRLVTYNGERSSWVFHHVTTHRKVKPAIGCNRSARRSRRQRRSQGYPRIGGSMICDIGV